MPEITQQLGFEAAQAISTLNQLNTAIKNVNAGLKTFNTRANAANGNAAAQSFRNVTTAAQGASTAANTATTSFTKTGQAGAKSAASITVSWETMLRVIQTQILVRALNNVIQLFSESADAAEEFQLAVGRIANIAQGPGSAIAELTDELRDLSVELGRPSAEVTEAAFEALQNDLGTTQETMELLRGAANDLSLVTGGTLAQSVNSLTSVLKAYNLEIDQADDVTDIFFTAIDKGRITLEELESSLGKVTPLAAALNIPFEQVAASLAAITQSGTNAAVAQTQLRNIFAKLIKPTETLDAVFTKLGVDTFQDLIERSGSFQTALTDIADALGNDERAIAKAFGTIRGQLGVFNLLANEGQIFSETLEAMAERAGRAAEGAASIDELDARDSQRAFAELDRTFEELGESTQILRTELVELFNSIVTNGDDAQRALLALTGVVGGLGASFAATRVTGLASLGLLGKAAAAVGVGLAAAFAITRIQDYISEVGNLSRSLDEARRASEAAFAQEAQQAIAEVDQATRSQIEASIALSKQWVDQVTSDYDTVASAAARANNQIIADAQSAIDSFVDARKDAVREMQRAIDEVDNRISESTSRIEQGLRSLDEFRFERSLRGLDLQEQAARRLEVAARAAAEAREAAAIAGTDEQAQADARALQAIAERKAEEALRAADATRNAQLIAKAERSVETAIQDGITSEKNLRMDLQRFNQDVLQEQLDAVDARFKAEEEALTKIIDLQTKLLNPDISEQAKLINQENLDEALDKFENLLRQDFNVDLFKQLNTQGFIDQTTQSLLQAFERAEFKMQNVREAVQAAMDSGPFDAAIRVVNISSAQTGSDVVDDLLSGAQTGNPAETIQAQEAALRKFIAQQEKARIEADRLGKSFRASATQLNGLVDGNTFREVDLNLQSLLQQAENIGMAGGDFSVQPLLAFQEALQQVRNNLGQVGPDTEAQLQGQIEAAREAFRALLSSQDLSTQQARAGLEAIRAAERALQARIQQSATQVDLVPVEAVDAARQRLTEIENAANQAILGINNNPVGDLFAKPQRDAASTAASIEKVSREAGTAEVAAGGLANSLGTASTSATGLVTTMNNVTAATNSAIEAANRLAEANARAARAAGSAQAAAQPRFHGGPVAFRANGGSMTRGQDKQLTALSAGEFVVNARSSRNFFSQLQAINAGQRPQFRETGGSVTNVGDVNVSVTTDSGQNVDGRGIAMQIRRELRRGTSSL